MCQQNLNQFKGVPNNRQERGLLYAMFLTSIISVSFILRKDFVKRKLYFRNKRLIYQLCDVVVNFPLVSIPTRTFVKTMAKSASFSMPCHWIYHYVTTHTNTHTQTVEIWRLNRSLLQQFTQKFKARNRNKINYRGKLLK